MSAANRRSSKPAFSRARSVAFVVGAAAAAACSPAAPIVTTPPVTPKPVATAAPKLPDPTSPARWSLQASRASRMHTRLDLGAEGTIYAGDGGERWLQSRDGASTRVAPELLSQSIVAALPATTGKGVYFAGDDGTIFQASDPIGAITTTHAPPRPVRSVSAGKQAIVAVADDGALLRTVDGGATWTAIALPGATGTLVDVALSANGEGLALVAPQRVYATLDDGATWTAIATPGIGARRVVADVDAGAVLEGMTGSAVLRTSPTRLERTLRPPISDGVVEMPATNETQTPSLANAALKGNAAMIADKYLEAIGDREDSTRWRLAYGPLGGPFEIRRVSALDGCIRVFVGGDARTLYAACDGEPKPSARGYDGSGPMGGRYGGYGAAPAGDCSELRILKSEDTGKTWVSDGAVCSSGLDVAHVWVAPDGALFLSGGCKKTHGYGYCAGQDLLVRNPDSKVFAKVALPRNVVGVDKIEFGPGDRAWALGRLASGGIALLSSTDGGRDFNRRVTLPSLPGKGPKDPSLSPARMQSVSLSVDDQGTVRAVAHANSEWVVYTTSGEDDATPTAARLGFPTVAAAIVGKHGFAVDPQGRGRETSDGGGSWSEVVAPRLGLTEPTHLEARRGREVGVVAYVPPPPPAIICGAYGCLFGDRATRVGWGADHATTTAASASREPRAGATFRCTTQGDWSDLGAVDAPPTAFEADLGATTRWSAIREDATKGTIEVVVASPATKGADPKGLDRKVVSLFGPAGKDTATIALPQLEGVAALRFSFKRQKNKPSVAGAAPVAAVASAAPMPSPIPSTSPRPSTPSAATGSIDVAGHEPIVDGQLVDVELAWWVASTGAVHHATIHGAGPLDAKDLVLSDKDFLGRPSVPLLSIAVGGIHVRPFGTRSEAPLYFVNDAGKVDKMHWPELPTQDTSGIPLELRIDAIRADGKSVVVGIGPTGVELVQASTSDAGSTWDMRAWGLWPDVARGTNEPEWGVAYVGGRPSLVTTWSGGGGVAPTSFAVPLRGGADDPGEPIFAPLQRQLGDVPRACTAASASAPRFVAPYSFGTRHAVFVRGEGADLLLATDAAVVHGASATDACASIYEARAVSNELSGPSYSALIAVDAPGTSTLFRIASGAVGVSARAMSCTAAPEPLPKELATIEGFAAPER